MSDPSTEALSASITNNHKILAIRAEHEQRLAAAVESVAMDTLHAVFRLGYECAREKAVAGSKD